jgi:hypothetical protein
MMLVVHVMPGLGPGIHVLFFRLEARKTWMAGTSPAMTETEENYLIASGLTGEPTAPVIGIAGATNMNS